MLLVRNLEGIGCSRCITIHSLAIFLPRVEDFVQQAHLVRPLARCVDMDQTAHSDPEQAHRRAKGHRAIQQFW